MCWSVLALGPAGCTVDLQYIIDQVSGQFEILTETQSIDAVLAQGTLSAEQERKLRLLVEAREFAANLGLHVGQSFTRYHETNGTDVAYNLSAAEQDSLTPYEWQIPVVGGSEALGFFAREDADAAAAELNARGYDTFIYGVDAYSTLGYLPDPVHSSFLERSDGSLVETVIHELAHNTVYSAGNSTFSETLATYVGRRGARLFFEQRGAEGAEILAGLEDEYADSAQITDWVQELTAALRDFYAAAGSRESKVAGREAVYQAARDRFVQEVSPQLHNPQRYVGWGQIPTNNAFLLLHQRYHLDLAAFDAVYQAVDGNFAELLARLGAAAGAADPFAALAEQAVR